MADLAGMSHRVSIRPFEPGDVDGAAVLLAERHRRHRLAEPLLDPKFEQPAVARQEIETLLAVDGAGSWTALRDGAIVGYLIGVARSEAVWGRNVWVEPAGHAAVEPSVVRSLYAVAADAWAAQGRFNHHALVPAQDEELVDAWFSLDFGQQHLHAVREIPASTFGAAPQSGLVVRAATRDDIPALAELDLALPRHSIGAPVFSRLPIPAVEEVVKELEDEFDGYTIVVAEYEGRVIGEAVGVPIERSSSNGSLMRPEHAGFLGYAAVLPEARGLGAGRALGEAILTWSRDSGFSSVVTDWRSTNLEADRAWRGLGFRPAFRRLHRLIG